MYEYTNLRVGCWVTLSAAARLASQFTIVSASSASSCPLLHPVLGVITSGSKYMDKVKVQQLAPEWKIIWIETIDKTMRYYPRPSWRQATEAAISSNKSSQTVPHCPLESTSTRSPTVTWSPHCHTVPTVRCGSPLSVLHELSSRSRVSRLHLLSNNDILLN